MDISVIIPCYNKEAYVEECVKSIVTQAFPSFEVLLVDDGSTDNTGRLCDQLAATDGRIRVFHRPNGGVTAARRYGYEQSQGRYVMFADCDDQLLPDSMHTLYATAEQTGADEVIGTYRTQNGYQSTARWTGWADIRELVIDLLMTRNSFCVLWAILFRRELLEGCLNTPREIISREDMLMQVNCLMKHPRVFFIDQQVYFYNEGLPNDRHTTPERIALYERELQRVLQPEWDTYRPYFVLHRIKLYEMLVFLKFFHIGDAYRDLRKEDLSGVPFADRLVFLLPTRLAYVFIWLRKQVLSRIL